MFRKTTAFLICFCLFFEQTGFAQVAGQLGIPAYLNGFIPTDKFRPIHLRSLSYDPLQNNFDLLLDKGDARDLKPSQIEETTQKLLEYFQIGISLPNNSFWVNLRPDSKEEMIDPYLEKTDLGKILLEADLQLKKDMAKFTSPDTPEGKEYWDKLYQKAESLFGGLEIEIPTFTRPWIVPGEILIREAGDNAYIYKATLKVMLEQDYLKDSAAYSFDDERLKVLNDYSSELIRKLIIPKLTRTVNSSKQYASLRQVYYSLILAQWFKKKFKSQAGVYSSRIDTMDLTGLASKTPWLKSTYFNCYQKSFKMGEYNLQETVYSGYGQTVRSYFSGGLTLAIPTYSMVLIKGDMQGLARRLSNVLEIAFGAGKITIQGFPEGLENSVEVAAAAQQVGAQKASGNNLAIRTIAAVQRVAGKTAAFSPEAWNAREEILEYSREHDVEIVAFGLGEFRDGILWIKEMVQPDRIVRVQHEGIKTADLKAVLPILIFDKLLKQAIIYASFTDVSENDYYMQRIREYARQKGLQVLYHMHTHVLKKRVPGITIIRSLSLGDVVFTQKLRKEEFARNFNGERIFIHEGAIQWEELVLVEEKGNRALFSDLPVERRDYLERRNVLMEDFESWFTANSGEILLGSAADAWFEDRLTQRMKRAERDAKAEREVGGPTTPTDGSVQTDGGAAEKDLAGIDLRTLPIATQPALSGPRSTVNSPQMQIPESNLDQEWLKIQKLMQEGPMPYNHIKEFVSCCKKHNADRQIDAVFTCIAQILRLEEERAIATAPELKEILILVESENPVSG
jgi:hypothetical protein